MFQGLHNCLMDDKGRVAFPAPLRASLDKMAGTDERFVLTQSLYDPCLVGMTEADFEAQAEKLRSLPPSEPAVVAFKRFVIAPATVASIDRAGRISVPKELREYAGLERESVWLGVVDKIELWGKARYDELRRKHTEQDQAAVRAFLARHGL